MKFKIILLCFGLFVFFLGKALAGVDQPVTANPSDVHVGLYINNIYNVSLRENSFSADFYVWFRWTDKNLKPLESFEVTNGRIVSKDGIYEDVVEGQNYASCRVVAEFTKFWDVSNFPLDTHKITIEIEDNDNEDFKVRYIPDATNSNYNPDVQVPGYKIVHQRAEVLQHAYKTNYGDISLPTDSASTYSRFVYSLQIERPGYGYFLKLFLSVFIATFIAFLCFAIKPTDLDPRFGLGIGAIFAAVASEYVVASALPESNVITLTDKLHILAIAFIFLSLLESTISLRIFTNRSEKVSASLDRISLIICPIVYLLLNALVVLKSVF
jgi:hypothetical protein